MTHSDIYDLQYIFFLSYVRNQILRLKLLKVKLRVSVRLMISKTIMTKSNLLLIIKTLDFSL